MRRFCTGLLAALLALGLVAAQPAAAKVYKMDPAERAAALKEKKAKRHKAKKAGKAEPGQDQGGWVEVKPGEQVAKRSRKAKAAEAMEPTKKKSRKHKKAAEETPQAESKPAKAEKKSRKAKTEEVAEPSTKKSRKHKKAAAEETPQVERKSAKAEKKSRKADKVEKVEKVQKTGKAEKVEAKAEKRSGKKSRRSASRGDRVIGNGYSGEQKVSASSAEVRRPADDLSAYSVSRPGQHQQKAAPAAQTPAAQTPAPQAPAAPEVRKEVQPGPLDTSTPVGTEQKTGEGRF